MAFAPCRPTTLALLALVAGLAVIPACKKKQSTKSNSSDTQNPDMPGPTGSNNSASTSPVFGSANPRVAATRQISQKNLKQLMMAMHSCHDAYGYLPAGIVDQSGKVGLSWRVALLPFLEHNNLYKQFKLDEPWDSEHNKKLIAQMPQVFDGTGGNGNGKTYYRSFTGPGTIMPPSTGGTRGQIARGVKIFDIRDGTSNTFAIAEAGPPVIWTKPDELAFSANGPVPKLGGLFADGYNVAFCDGSVRFFTKNALTDQVLKACITTSGNDLVNLP